MEIISSDQNKIYKLFAKLRMKKYRDRTGLYPVEGYKLVEEAVIAGKAEIVVIREDLAATCALRGKETVFMKGGLFGRIALTETSQGIMAAASMPDIRRDEFRELISRGSGNVIVLDGLQDPGNIGTIIRTADAAGYKGVMTVKGTCDIYSPKVARSAMGSLFRVPVYRVEDSGEAAAFLKECGKKTVGTDIAAEKYYYEEDLTENIALVIGNEGRGMSEEFKKITDVNIKLPMSTEIDSLNAAVAAGILMYRSFEKR